jgi:hypothetical protein
MTYRKYNRRDSSPQMTGPRPNTYAGNCDTCGVAVAARAGILTGSKATGYTVRHAPATWNGSPVSGGWVNGCPADTDSLNAALGHVDDNYVRNMARASEIDVNGPREMSRRAGGKYAYTSGGARMTERSQRCEDAPCCGCCD